MSGSEPLSPPGRAGTVSTSPRTADSGIWARSRRAPQRRQEGPLPGRPKLPVWLSWCAALLFFAGVVAIVFATLLELTRELVALGHEESPRALSDEH